MHLKFFVGLCTVSLVSSQSFSFGIGFDNASPSAVSSGFPFQTTAFEPQRSQTNSRGASRKASESATRPEGDRQSSQNIRESISSFIFSGLDDEPAQTSARQSTSHRSREQPKQTVQQRQSTQEQTLPEVNRQRVPSVRSRQQTQRQATVASQPHNQQQLQHPQVQRQQQLQVVQQQQPQPQQQQPQQPQPQQQQQQDPQVQHQQQQQLQIEQLQQIQQQQQQQQKQQLQQQKDLLQQQIQRQQHPKTHRQQQQQQNFQPQQFEEISRVSSARKTETQTISSLSSPIQFAPVQQVNEVNIGKSPCARGSLGHECRMNLKNAALSCTSGKCHQCQQCGSVPVNDWITCCRDHFLCCRPLARSCQRCDQPLLTSFCNVAFGKCK